MTLPRKCVLFNTLDSLLLTKKAHIRNKIYLGFFYKSNNHPFWLGFWLLKYYTPAGQCFIKNQISNQFSLVLRLNDFSNYLGSYLESFQDRQLCGLFVSRRPVAGMWFMLLVLQNHFLCRESCFFSCLLLSDFICFLIKKIFLRD